MALFLFEFFVFLSFVTPVFADSSLVNQSAVFKARLTDKVDYGHLPFTAFLIAPEWIMTSDHVFKMVQNPGEFEIIRGEDFTFSDPIAKPICDESLDYCVVKMEAKIEGVTPVSFSLEEAHFDFAYFLVGNYGLTPNSISIQSGSLAPKQDPGFFDHCIPTQKAISGSPIFNKAGSVVALHRGTLHGNFGCTTREGVGVAIPISRILKSIELTHPALYKSLNIIR